MRSIEDILLKLPPEDALQLQAYIYEVLRTVQSAEDLVAGWQEMSEVLINKSMKLNDVAMHLIEEIQELHKELEVRMTVCLS